MDFSPKTDWQIQELKGSVKSITHIKNDILQNEQRKVKTEFSPNGFVTKRQTFINSKTISVNSYEYNAQNLLIKSSDLKYESRYTYEQEPDGTIKSTQISYPKDNDERKIKITSTRYDQNGLIAAQQVFMDGYVIYDDLREYFDDALLKRVTDVDNGVVYEFSYHFDKNGNLIQKELRDYKTLQINYFVYEPQGGLVVYEETDGKKIENGQNKIISHYEYKNIYDKFGNITHIKAYDKNSKLIREESFEYEYY